jgi:hypothetical protein
MAVLTTELRSPTITTTTLPERAERTRLVLDRKAVDPVADVKRGQYRSWTMRKHAPMTSELVLDRIRIAKRELAEAQRALDTLLRTMEVASQTETTPVTAVVEQAFNRIKTAQANLLELRKLLTEPAE